MKKILILLAVILVVSLGIPPAYSMWIAPLLPLKVPESFEVLQCDSGDVLTLTAQEYLEGCLFAQINVEYPPEALKAQAAAAFTYAVKLLADGVSLSDSAAECQPYFTPEQAVEYYGESDYNRLLDTVRQAAQWGARHLITYDGKPIYSVYHSLSAGRTNLPENVWGIHLPYLKSVDCADDFAFDGFRATNEISLKNMQILLLKYEPTIAMPVDLNLWFDNENTDQSGYVISLSVGGKSFNGGDFWRILNLRSTAFRIRCNGMAFEVETLGHGHGVGMSQYTAACMAQRGSSAEEILTYFYDGVSVRLTGS